MEKANIRTRRARKAARLQEWMQEDDLAELRRLERWREDCIDKRDSMAAKRDIEISKIEQEAREKVDATKGMFSQFIDAEQRRINEIDAAIKELRNEDEEAGTPGLGHNSGGSHPAAVPAAA